MKQLLALVCSPRKLGNCETLAKAIDAAVPEEHELRLLNLAEWELKGCTGCYRCLYEGSCHLDDGLGAILDAIEGADALIVAAPAYFLGAHASLKRLMDRGLSFYARKDRLWGKPALALAVAGIPGKEGGTLLTVQAFLKSILADIRASEVVYAALPGEALFTDGYLGMLERMGRALFGEAAAETGPDRSADGAPRCPACGGDSFRFPGGDRLRCLLCGSTGRWSAGAGGPALEMEPDALALHADAAGAAAHEDWLRGMKDRLVAELPRVRAVRERWRGGQWIRPPRP